MPFDPLDELASFDWEAFTREAKSALGDEGRALAENIARNVTESVRQTRNALEAAVDSPKTSAEISDETKLDLAPQRERGLRASFETHLRGLFRRTASAIGAKFKAKRFIGLHPDGRPAVEFRLPDVARENLTNLGPHPHSELFAAPVPPSLERAVPFAKELAHLTPREQADWLASYTEALAQKKPLPPLPGPTPDSVSRQHFTGRLSDVDRPSRSDLRLKKIFKRPPKNEELARLAGAPDNAEMDVKLDAGNSISTISFHPFFDSPQIRTIGRDPAGNLFIENRNMILKRDPDIPARLGLRSLASQVAQARRMDVRYIQMNAARTDTMIGYRVFPEYGFDGPIPEDLFKRLRVELPGLRGTRTVAELVRSPEGKAWWRMNGRTVELRFDLSAGSASMERLNAALRKFKAEG